MWPSLQGSIYQPITQKQADSAHIHERLAAHKTPMMLTAANVSLAAPFGSTPLGCSNTTWGLGNTTLCKCVPAKPVWQQSVTACAVLMPLAKPLLFP